MSELAAHVRPPAPTARRRRGVCAAWACALLASASGGCGDLLPPFPDTTAPPLDTARDVDAADLPDIGVVACETDADCASYAACCLDVACVAGACMPRYVPDCCVTEGPCAVSTPHHTGTCEETCTPWGCAHALRLGSDRCDETLWSLELDAAGLGALTVQDEAADRVTWHLSPLRPFDGRPSLRAGDLLCPSYHTGPLDAACAASGEGGLVRMSFDTPPVPLPPDVVSLVELMLWLDLGGTAAPDGGALAIDGLELFVLPEGQSAASAWSSRPPRTADGRRWTPLPPRRWVPLLVDLSPYAGQTIRLRVVFDTLDGRDNDHEGAAIGRLRLRTACEGDRDAADRGPCAVATPARVHPLDDLVVVHAPPSDGHDRPCETCEEAMTCAIIDGCDRATCEANTCRVTRALSEECCTSDPRWPGDASFEDALEGWALDGLWGSRALESRSGERALHFGTEDGTALSPEGEAAAGEAWSPPVTIPAEQPVWSFSVWLSTEWDSAPSTDNPGRLDVLEAFVQLEGPPSLPSPAIVWRSDELGGTTAGSWRRVAIPLGAFAGRTVRLGWRFSTGDADANRPGAVFIDDAAVYRACPGCPPEDAERGRCGGTITR